MEILTLSTFKRRRGGGGEGEGYGRGLSGVWQLIQLSHGSLPIKILSGCTQKLLCEVHILHFAYFLF